MYILLKIIQSVSQIPTISLDNSRDDKVIIYRTINCQQSYKQKCVKKCKPVKFPKELLIDCSKRTDLQKLDFSILLHQLQAASQRLCKSFSTCQGFDAAWSRHGCCTQRTNIIRKTNCAQPAYLLILLPRQWMKD